MKIYQFPKADTTEEELIRGLKCSCGSKRGFDVLIYTNASFVTCRCRGCGILTDVQPECSVCYVMGPAKLKKIKKEVDRGETLQSSTKEDR